MPHTVHDIGLASQIGDYSDAIEAGPNLRATCSQASRAWPSMSSGRSPLVERPGVPEVTSHRRLCPASMASL